MLLAPFSSEQRAEMRQMIESICSAVTATEVFLDQLRDGGGDLVNVSSVAGAPRARATPSTPPPSGG